MNKKTKKLLHENNLMDKTLNKENRDVLTDIVVYLRDCDISEYQQEEVRRDIMNMLAEGEARNEDARTVIGGNYKEFCDEIVRSLPPLTFREKAFSMLSGLFGSMSVLLIIYLVQKVVGGVINKTSVTVLPLTLGDLVNGILIILIATVVVKVVCKTSFKSQNPSKIKTFLISWVILTAMFCLLFAISHFLTLVVANLHIIFWVGMILALYLASYIIENYIAI